jgi:hypothetical protein
MTMDLTGISSVTRATPDSEAQGASSVAGSQPTGASDTGTPSVTQDPMPAATDAPSAVQGKLQMNVDPQTSQLVIKLVDGDSTEIIRRIPAEAVVEFAQTLDSATGNLVQSEA